MGCSTAYYLAKLGWKDVVILERKQLTSGTMWHTAGLVGEFYFPEDGRANPVDATMSLAKGARELAGPLKKRFVQFLLNNPEPLLYFGEMIYRNGKQVGYVRSGAYRFTLGGSVALSLIGDDEPIDEEYIKNGKFEIEVNGVMCSAKAFLRSMYDPKNERVNNVDENHMTYKIKYVIISYTKENIISRCKKFWSDLGGEMYRLKVVSLFFVAVLIITGLPGCQSTAPAITAPTQKNITIVIPEDPPSFNPIIVDSGYDALVMELVMLGLSDIDPDGNVFPELAAELPTIENGDVVVDETAGTMTVTWKMRQDVQWADGKPVTADDVIFTYDAIVNPETGGWIPGIDNIDSIDKVDDYTFTINYNAIYPAYLTQFGGEQVAIWPAHYCDASQGFAAWDCARKPLSDGPFVLTEWINGDHMTFVRNDNYFEKGKPAIDKVTINIVPDQTVRKTMLINGDADLDMWTTEPIIADLKGEPNVEVNPSPTNRFVMRIYMNLAAKGTTDPVATPHPILSDLRVRQAIRAAIDVDTISKEFFLGYAQPVWNDFFRPPYICDNIPRPKFDLAAASALLDEAGWKDTDGDGVRECHGCKTAEEGYVMEMEFITYAEYGEPLELTQQFIAEQLGKLGIKLNLTVVEGSVLWAAATDGGIEQNGNFDMDIWDDGYSGVDPTNFITSYYATESAIPDAGYNFGRWSNPEFDELLTQVYTLDEQQRKDSFCKMASILEEDLPELLLFTAINADAHSTRLQNVQSTTNDLVTWNSADWTLK